MTASEISRAIKVIICKLLTVSSEMVTPEARFIEDLGADSLRVVELLFKIEERFNVEIPDEDAEQLATVGSVTNYVYSKLTGTPVELSKQAPREIIRTDCH